MRFITKVEAIHPRGNRKGSGVKPGKNAFSSGKGKTLKANLDWLASSVNSLVDDYVFAPKTNKLLEQVISSHKFIVDGLSVKTQIESYLKLASLAEKLGSEFERLLKADILPEGVTEAMVKEFVEMARKIEEHKEQLEEAGASLKELSRELSGLGFKL